MYVDLVPEPPAPVVITPKVEKVETQPVPTSKIIIEEVNEVPQIKIERKRKEDTIEEVSLPHGVQLKTVQTKHSPLKKHIITSTAHRRPSDTGDAPQPQIVTVAVSESLKVRLQNHLLSTQSGVLVQNGPFSPVAVLPMQQAREAGVTVSSASPRRVSAPLVQLAAGSLSHKPIQLQSHAPLVVASVAAGVQHVPANKLKVLHAHPLTHAQRAQLLTRAAPLPGVVALAPADAKPPRPPHHQLFEIKAKQLGKGPHLVNVVRQPQPGKTTVTRLDLNDSKKRQVVFDAALKGALPLQSLQPPRPQRLSVSLDARHLVRATLPHAHVPHGDHVPHVPHMTHMPHVRAPHVRHQIQLKNRTLQVSAPSPLRSPAPPPAVAKAAAPGAVVASLLHKAGPLPKGGPKLAIGGGAPLAANVQAIAFTAAQLKARQARLVQPRPKPNNDMVVDTSSVPGSAAAEPMDAEDETVRRRDSLPMEVT